MKLMIVGPQNLTDIRVVRAAVRTASWEGRAQKLIIPHVGSFSDVTLRWAREQWITATVVPLEVWKYGNASRAAVERDEAGAKLATHLLVVMDYEQRHLAYWTKLANRRNLSLFQYYAVC